MNTKTNISWTDTSWNPVTGCSKISAGCKFCYAEVQSAKLHMWGNKRYRNGFNVTLHEDLLDQPSHWRKARLVFVNSMSDLFHEKVPDDFIRRVFTTINQCPQHEFQILTKRPKRLARLAPDLNWSPNIWMGVSVENEQHLWRIKDLKRVEARVRFVSIEPLLGPLPHLDLDGIHWVIVGGESGEHFRRMNPDWVRSIRDKSIAAGVPFYFKQWDARFQANNPPPLDGRIWKEFPKKSSDLDSQPEDDEFSLFSLLEAMPTNETATV